MNPSELAMALAAVPHMPPSVSQRPQAPGADRELGENGGQGGWREGGCYWTPTSWWLSLRFSPADPGEDHDSKTLLREPVRLQPAGGTLAVGARKPAQVSVCLPPRRGQLGPKAAKPRARWGGHSRPGTLAQPASLCSERTHPEVVPFSGEFLFTWRAPAHQKALLWPRSRRIQPCAGRASQCPP